MRPTIMAVAISALTAGLLTATPASADAHPLDRFRDQSLTWQPCDDPRLDPAGAQCAEVTVPVDYSAPQAETMTVAISRLPATDPAKRRGVLMSNPGGPGGPGLDFMIDVREAMSSGVRDSYDLIGMDPRGVGRSTPVNCRWQHGFGMESAGLDSVGFAESVAQQAELLGAVFTQLFPQRSDWFVLDSAVDPEHYGSVGMVRAMGPVNEAAFDRWADWVAAHDTEFGFGADRSAVRSTVQDMVRDANERPIRIGEFTVDEHILPMVLYRGARRPAQLSAAGDAW